MIEPLIPPAKGGGNKRTVDVREIVKGLTFILGTGCQWALLPNGLLPRGTANRYFKRWDHDRTLHRLHPALYVRCREQAGRDANPTVRMVKRSDAGRFVVLPKRWIVERTIAWLNRCRRLAKHWKRLNQNALAFLRWASIRLVLRKLCQNSV